MSLQNELWDKPNAIVAFNDNNTNSMDKCQKFIGETCKNHSVNIINQKRMIEKFLLDNEDLKKSPFTFNNCLHYLVDRILEIQIIHETFNEMLLKESEIIKDKVSVVKKDTKAWKNDKKKIFDDIAKETQKRDNEFKRYCNRYHGKEAAYSNYLRAEENKSLSRNQVDNYNKMYATRKAEYEQSKQDYVTVLENFNKFQTNHYAITLLDWTMKGEDIEQNRYDILKSTFTNLLELCRSLASKFQDLADKIESESESIDCSKDRLTLVNQEKTGDIPPGPISFKDFEAVEVIEEPPEVESRKSKVSSTNSESTSVSSGKHKDSTVENKLQTSTSNSNSALNVSVTSTSSNGTSGGGKIFSKIFGGLKKSKESSDKNIQTEIESLENLLKEKLSQNTFYDINDPADLEIDEIKSKIESLKSELTGTKTSSVKRKNSLLQSVKSNSRNKSVDIRDDSISKDKTFSGKISFTDKTVNRRSQSVSSIIRSVKDVNDDTDGAPQSLGTKSSKSSKFISPLKSKNKERKEISSIYSRSIEVIRNNGPVEIVSTPAEAMASANRVTSEYVSEYEITRDISNHKEVSLIEAAACQNSSSETYPYYYVGSCVAIHEYTTSDPSNIYLSFNAGEQFYIIQEDENCSSSGWLFVERIDKSAIGYVPQSYMDTKNYETPVVMFSDRPMILT